ncbi:MAG: hypothetical protein WCY00_02905 [Candidatus Dojkabacteria bacterium]|jgi:hypothetical protein
MKKLHIFFTVLFSFLLPLSVMAAVDITMNDTSTNDDYTVSISIDTEGDTLDSIVLPIQFSEEVTISEVSTGTVICNKFDSSEDDNILTITCELDSPSSLNGILATIDFTSTSDEYSFKVLENNSDFDIGGLDLGIVTNIGSDDIIPLPISDVMMDDEDTAIPFEEDMGDSPFVISDETDSIEEKGGFMDFLPYILIGGSVILLISIVAILLSKKDSSKKSKDTDTPVDDSTPTDSTAIPADSTLKDMVNSPTPVQQDTPVPTTIPVQQDTPPVVQTPPPVQDTPVSVTPAPAQPTPQAYSTTEEQDLADILRSESSAGIDTTPIPADAPPVQSTIQPETMEPQATNIPTQPSPAPTPEDILSSTVTEELNGMQQQQPQTTPTQPTTTPPTTEELPPIPPTM